MENYSQTSQDILQKLIDQLEQGVAQVAEAENTTRDKVMKCAKLTIRDQIFKMERAKNTFNLFCEEFKTEYNDKKEEFQNKYPKSTTLLYGSGDCIEMLITSNRKLYSNC